MRVQFQRPNGHVDRVALVEAAAGAGGTADPREPQDHGFMYGRTFEDPDGRTFEPMWMNMEDASAAAEEWRLRLGGDGSVPAFIRRWLSWTAPPT